MQEAFMQHHAARAVDYVDDPTEQNQANLPGWQLPKACGEEQRHNRNDGQGDDHDVNAHASESLGGCDLFG